MTALAPTAARVAPVNDTQYVARTYIAAAAITAGQVVYINSAGKAALARGNALGTMQGLAGIATHNAGANQPVEVLSHGALEGMGVGALAYALPIYVSSATAGSLDDAAVTGSGNVAVVIGRVAPMSGPGLEKVLWVDIPLSALYAAIP